jgi:hypothetical protein
MNQPKQPQGNFTMNLNFRRNGNAKAPPITGRISTPEDPETEFAYSAFEHTDKNGETYWIGPVDMSRSMRQALNATPTNGTHFVAIRENGFKVFKEHHDGAPNPAYATLTSEQQEHEDSKPAYWATWTRTDAEPQLRASAWEREPNRYGPWASGNTQHPLSKEDAALLKAGHADAAVLNAPEPKAASRRARKADEHERA